MPRKAMRVSPLIAAMAGKVARGLVPCSLVLLVTSGCMYAAPVRGAISGAPGRLRAGETSLTASGSYRQAPAMGAVHVSHAITDVGAIEAGVEFMYGGRDSSSAMASIGGRITGRAREDEDVRLAGDLEFGGGAGMGGSLSRGPDQPPPRPWHVRPGGGGYLGMGGGVSYRWLTWFLRARGQVSAAKSVGMNTWFMAATGPEFSIRNVAFLHAAYVPVAIIDVGSDGAFGFLVHAWELGLSFKFGGARRRRVGSAVAMP